MRISICTFQARCELRAFGYRPGQPPRLVTVPSTRQQRPPSSHHENSNEVETRPHTGKPLPQPISQTNNIKPMQRGDSLPQPTRRMSLQQSQQPRLGNAIVPRRVDHSEPVSYLSSFLMSYFGGTCEACFRTFFLFRAVGLVHSLCLFESYIDLRTRTHRLSRPRRLMVHQQGDCRLQIDHLRCRSSISLCYVYLNECVDETYTTITGTFIPQFTSK